MPSAATARWVRSSPSSSPMSIRSVRSSTYLPANGFSITATAAARRVGGVIARPISVWVSSTKVAILRMQGFIGVRLSSEPVDAFDFRGLQAAGAGVDAWASGHDQGQENFVGARGVGDADFHGIEVAANVRGVDVRDGHVEAGARAAHFFCRSHDGFGVAEDLAHAVAAGGMPESAVFELSGSAYDRAFAVALDGFGISSQRCNQRPRHC